MNFTLMIYETPEGFAQRLDPTKSELYMGGWMAYAKALREAGVMAGGAGMQPPATATTVTLSAAAPIIQDGPFADAKEQLGGYFVIDVPNLDAALQWAARIPGLPGTVIEVRPNLPSPPPQA